MRIAFCLITFAYGLVIGSFVNVVICRVPQHQDIVKVRSHCMSCGYQLRWFDLIPVFSWLFLGGKCRKCHAPISVQYPLIELLNGICYVLISVTYGFCMETLLLCLMSSALIALAVIDFRTYEIPQGINIFIGVLGAFSLLTDLTHWQVHLIGLFSVSLFLELLYLLSGGRAIGGGDIKLMAVTGLLIGWKLNLLAFFLGCIYGAVIHVLRMKLSHEGHVLALGPYLAMGIMTAVLYGDRMLTWYFSML
jgi:leader peptidase (prepilin peptidase)/N-methyltransferase